MKFNCISLFLFLFFCFFLLFFLFFFFFCYPEIFFSDFWVRKDSRSIIFLNLSLSLPLSLSLSLSFSLFLSLSSSLVHTQFSSLTFHSQLASFATCLHVSSLSRVSSLSNYYFVCYFPFKSTIRDSVIKI